MLKDITAVKPLKDHRLHLIFEDGVEGIVSLKKLIQFTGVFEPLLNPKYFETVQVNADLGTICWKNGADLDPVMLYTVVTGQPIEIN
jgi:Protein of unknown function (DUF2442)